MLYLLQISPSKVLTTFLSKFRALGSSQSWSYSFCRNTVLPPRTLSTCIPPLYNLTPPLLMQHSCPTLVYKPPIPFLPALYLLPLPPHHRSLLLAFLLRLLTHLLPLTLSGFISGKLEVFEPGALNYFTFSQPTLSTLFVSRNPI